MKNVGSKTYEAPKLKQLGSFGALTLANGALIATDQILPDNTPFNPANFS